MRGCGGAVCVSQPFALSNLEECEVLLLDACAQVTVDELSGCEVFIGEGAGGVLCVGDALKRVLACLVAGWRAVGLAC